ncbi:MAG: ATP-binding protein [Acidobacteriia bacterium]|nr:ATP-binding protein [Terriglobia bacterium]
MLGSMTMVTVRQTFDSTLVSTYSIEDLALEIARRAGFRGPSLDHISLAVHETAVNAVVHGNQYSQEKKVRVEISATGNQFRIRIADQGPGFDPDALLDPSQPEDLFRSSGRGVSLSRQVMDEYHVRPLCKGGTEVTLVKYLAAAMSNSLPLALTK